MKPIIRIFSGVLFALCCSGLAAANPPDPTQSLDSSIFRTVTTMQLDAAFESFAAQNGPTSPPGLVGPSAMDCNHANQNGVETCVVTTPGRTASIPAALAQH